MSLNIDQMFLNIDQMLLNIDQMSLNIDKMLLNIDLGGGEHAGEDVHCCRFTGTLQQWAKAAVLALD
jgi:hypothetical protein